MAYLVKDLGIDVLIPRHVAEDIYWAVDVFAINIEDGTKRMVQDEDDLCYDLYGVSKKVAECLNLI